ncbi:MAG: hypothetical protein O3C60_18435, partial [Planctomycetota bacterium]|nr:hypothetical protein [Planctomycetota bacterium]
LPDYGSLGASCYVEFEIDRCLIDQDLDGFHHKVAGAFAACRQAVNDQLAQQSDKSSLTPGNNASNGVPHHNGHTRHSGNGQGARQEVASATQSQVRAIFAIARRQRADPAILVRERFNVERPEDLSIREASTLIDDLKRGAIEVRS